MEAIPIVLFGLVIGSFLNVVIHRLPRDENVVFPRSRCPHCQALIRFYDNIPIVSYFVLLGRCRHCRHSISPLYPMVEGLTAWSFWLVYCEFGLTLYSGFCVLFICILIVLAFIDLRHMILPDPLTLGGAAIFFCYSFFNPYVAPLDAILSAVVVTLLFSGLFLYYLKIRKIEGIGFGDVKMVFFLGLFLGHRYLVVAILLSSLSGLLAGLYFIVFKKKNLKYALPFGTFLGLGSFISLFWGDAVLAFISRVLSFHA